MTPEERKIQIATEIELLQKEQVAEGSTLVEERAKLEELKKKESDEEATTLAQIAHEEEKMSLLAKLIEVQNKLKEIQSKKEGLSKETIEKAKSQIEYFEKLNEKEKWDTDAEGEHLMKIEVLVAELKDRLENKNPLKWFTASKLAVETRTYFGLEDDEYTDEQYSLEAIGEDVYENEDLLEATDTVGFSLNGFRMDVEDKEVATISGVFDEENENARYTVCDYKDDVLGENLPYEEAEQLMRDGAKKYQEEILVEYKTTKNDPSINKKAIEELIASIDKEIKEYETENKKSEPDSEHSTNPLVVKEDAGDDKTKTPEKPAVPEQKEKVFSTKEVERLIFNAAENIVAERIGYLRPQSIVTLIDNTIDCQLIIDESANYAASARMKIISNNGALELKTEPEYNSPNVFTVSNLENYLKNFPEIFKQSLEAKFGKIKSTKIENNKLTIELETKTPEATATIESKYRLGQIITGRHPTTNEIEGGWKVESTEPHGKTTWIKISKDREWTTLTEEEVDAINPVLPPPAKKETDNTASLENGKKITIADWQEITGKGVTSTLTEVAPGDEIAVTLIEKSGLVPGDKIVFYTDGKERSGVLEKDAKGYPYIRDSKDNNKRGIFAILNNEEGKSFIMKAPVSEPEKTEQKEKIGTILYAGMPDADGSFRENRVTTEVSPIDSLYQMQITGENRATVKFINEGRQTRTALASPESVLFPVVQVKNMEDINRAIGIQTIQSGVYEKRDGKWVLEEPPIIEYLVAEKENKIETLGGSELKEAKIAMSIASDALQELSKQEYVTVSDFVAGEKEPANIEDYRTKNRKTLSNEAKAFLEAVIEVRRLEQKSERDAGQAKEKEREAGAIGYTEYAKKFYYFDEGAGTSFTESKGDNMFSYNEATGSVLPLKEGWVGAKSNPSYFIEPFFSYNTFDVLKEPIENLLFVPMKLDKKGRFVEKGKILLKNEE